MNDKTIVTVHRDGFIGTLEMDHMKCGDIEQLRELFMRLAMASGYHPETVQNAFGELL